MKSRTTKEAACFRIRLADRDPPTPPRQFVSDGQASDPSTKDCRGFDQAFPLAHKYLGFRDFFGRSNINTPNVLLTMKPSPKCQVPVWYYYFFLDNLKDHSLQRNHDADQPNIHTPDPRFGA